METGTSLNEPQTARSARKSLAGNAVTKSTLVWAPSSGVFLEHLPSQIVFFN